MAVDKFKFISPGIFMDEIDESALPALPERMGPVIVGRFAKGPANRPIKVETFKEFVQIFGRPSAGTPSGDVWRNGALTAPTYAAYAVQAWLRNNSPCTVYRLLGDHPTSAETSYESFDKALPGWRTDELLTTDRATCGGAFGLFVTPDGDQYTATNSGNGAHSIVVATSCTAGAANTRKLKIYDADSQSVEFDIDNTTSTSTATVIAFGNANSNAAQFATNIIDAVNAAYTAGTLKVQAVADPVTTAGVRLVSSVNGTVGNSITATEGSAVTDNVILANSGGGATAWAGGGTCPAVTGTLAAIWYVQDGGSTVEITGTAPNGRATEGCGVLIRSTNQQFTAKVKDASGSTVKAATFNFDKDSDLYIRKLFNTDPTKTNTQITPADSEQVYWLGETFETNVLNDMAVTGAAVTSTGQFWGAVVGLQGNGWDVDWADRLQKAVAARTGWYISQDTRGLTTASFNPTVDTEELFRFVAHDSGEHINRDIKISLQDIKAPTDNFNKFGTFTLAVRAAGDSDNNPVILERFSGLNLNPNSADYIKKVVGDRSYAYNQTTKTITEHGEYPNRSKYVRVETKRIVDDAGAEGLLPYGVYGPVIPRELQLLSGSLVSNITDNAGVDIDPWIASTGSLPADSLVTGHAAAGLISVGPGAAVESNHLTTPSNASGLTASLQWPSTRLRVSASEGNMVMATRAYFGYQSTLADTRIFDKTNLDLLRGQPAGVLAGSLANETKYSWVFTLDDVESVSGSGGFDTSKAIWVSGSRASGRSITAGETGTPSVTSSAEVLERDWNRFTSPMFGGFDGLDITEADPFRNEYIDNGSENTNYAYYSVKKAIDILSDSEFAEFDVATIPGLTNSKLNTMLVNACEDRADALAIIDVEGGYKPRHENDDDEAARMGTVSDIVNKAKDLSLNSSYGCAFYPWVRIKDNVNDAILYVPPSVVALGTFSSSQRKSAVWFAPAGFTRGGLSEGSAGLPVIGVRERLTSALRDKLYDANVNPIASFPAEGIVIFGQKTLQVTPSALDRINVRRLLIFIKKEISQIASRILFDQNVVATWDKFTGQVEPFLEGVKAGLGLTDFRVVLDETTTTPDLVDRNILYAKIFLKPARAIEFIALDFIITRSGASFDD